MIWGNKTKSQTWDEVSPLLLSPQPGQHHKSCKIQEQLHGKTYGMEQGGPSPATTVPGLGQLLPHPTLDPEMSGEGLQGMVVLQRHAPLTCFVASQYF